MSELIARTQFDSTLDYAALGPQKLVELYTRTLQAHANFFGLWQRAVTDTLGAERCAEYTALVYPRLTQYEGDLERQFYEELNFLWSLMPGLAHMLTFARYDDTLLPATLDATLEFEKLSPPALVLLWNVATLTYVMQTSRWTDLITQKIDQNTALKLERDVWLDYGGATEDLRYGLQAAGAEHGDVETLLRGFQMAPGEVGLVDAQFELHDPRHGIITHRRCPSHEGFGQSNRERLESNCVLCVIAMRLSGEMVNESIRCRPVAIPPHRESPGYACRWEYWMEDDNG